MIGGGRGAFIGAVHRMATALDGQIELVCGAFSSDPERSKLSGGDLFLAAERCYGTYEEMILTEATLPAHIRMDMVSIVTPNHMHFGPAMMALDHGSKYTPYYCKTTKLYIDRRPDIGSIDSDHMKEGKHS